MGSKEKEKEKDASGLIGGIVVGAVVLFAVGLPVFLEEVLPHIHGATPAQLMDEPLARSPKQLASDLPSTKRSSNMVTVSFKKGAAGDYEKAEYTWDASTSDAPNSLRLRVEYHEKAPDVSPKLTRHFHAFQDGKHSWGPVTIRARDDGGVLFQVDRLVDGKTNPLFDRQIEAAKEVILNAAFDLPLRVSEQEIVDVLGAGYAPATLAKLDVMTTVEQAAAALRAIMPATLGSGSSFDVPLDHPLIPKVHLSWMNQPRGRLSSVDLSTGKRYAANRNALEACLEKKLGPPKIDVTDYARGQKDFLFLLGTLTLRLGSSSIHLSTNGLDDDSFARLFQALDACRDSGESGGGTR
ncbi:MAG TPA: hypothetical protein VGH28_10925 [Polyangiaceae bacterium]|jgi:hypothetical protein